MKSVFSCVPASKLWPILFFILCCFATTVARAGESIPETAGRQSVPFNTDWQFHFAYDFEKKAVKQTVTLPHTWNVEDVLEGIDYKKTTGIYEKSLEVTETMQDKRLFLYFEGANKVATVLINNRFATEHKGGYTGFAVEITDFVKPGTNNVKVLVSNAYRLDVIPLHGDFNMYGGLHRPVSLLVTPKNCITPLDYGAPGVYIAQKQVSEKAASVEVLTKLSVAAPARLAVRTTVLDHNKKTVATTQTALSDGSNQEVRQSLDIKKPRLWNGKQDPYLYTVRAELLQDGQVIDVVHQPLGLRYFSVDADKGFSLNGKYLDLYGVGMHEDVAGKGSAISDADVERDMELIKELGATAVRLTHYPHKQHIYDLADKNGIVLWTEIPFVGPGGYTGTGYVKSPDLEASVKQNLLELIRQNYNHPSVIFWGLFNELKLDYDDPVPFIGELNALAKAEDPGRLTAIASNLGAKEFSDVSDLMAWNMYFGWYGGKFEQVGAWADKTHAALPGKPIALSEYGAGASPFKHMEKPEKVEPTGKFHPEEWQTAFHEKHWAELKKRPFVWAKLIWVLSDFSSSIRTEGDLNGINDKGLVTYDRGIKKDAFHFYKANWNPEPMVYIAERRNTERTTTTTQVKVYTNQGKVELWINGKSLGQSQPDELNTIIWENVPLKKGKNIIEVKTRGKGKVLEDRCERNLI